MANGTPGRRCSICLHPARAMIDAGLLSGRKPADLSREYKLSADALFRHSRRHVSAAIAAGAPVVASDADAAPVDLVADMKALRTRLLKQMTAVERKHDARAAVLIARELCRVSETIGRLTGQIDAAGTMVNVGVQFGSGGRNLEQVKVDLMEKIRAMAAAYPTIEGEPIAQ